MPAFPLSWNFLALAYFCRTYLGIFNVTKREWHLDGFYIAINHIFTQPKRASKKGQCPQEFYSNWQPTLTLSVLALNLPEAAPQLQLTWPVRGPSWLRRRSLKAVTSRHTASFSSSEAQRTWAQPAKKMFAQQEGPAKEDWTCPNSSLPVTHVKTLSYLRQMRWNATLAWKQDYFHTLSHN